MTASRSWQLTAPLRFVGRLIRDELGIVFALLQSARRQLATVGALFRAVPRAVSFYQGSLRHGIRRVLRVLKREGISGVTRRANVLVYGASMGSHQKQSSISLYGEVPRLAPGFMPKVSIIVPNFNHAKYLLERLESIYGQTYGNVEVILLDDCSSDESAAILHGYVERYPDRTLCRFNEKNSGGVFNQWKKGLELATGELVWIAESDDYCSPNLLEELVRCFQNPAVMLAFARTEFVLGTPPKMAWTSKEYLSDLGLDMWDRPFIASAHAMVKSGWAVKNIVPNVSAVVFRHPGKMALLGDSQWLNLRMCGDWVFYLSIIRGGLVAYSPDATNYYRQHSLNTSVNAQREDLYYREHEIVAQYLAKLYRLDRADFEQQERYLYQHWCINRGASQLGEFKALYDLDKVRQRTKDRRPNIVLAVYALAAGGGETFPIMLANLLQDRGYAVTLLNCKEQTTEPGVRNMLLGCTPLLELDRIELADAVFTDMGVELVHSHHAWVDVSLAMFLLNNQDIRQIVTMHGMYEMMTSAQLQTLLPLLKRRIDRFVYTAEKNLVPFSPEFRQEKGFFKINNALPLTGITPISRDELNVGADDFVLCLVARAIPDKGWEEAIDAVAWASMRSNRKVHLLLIGEGSEFDRLKSQTTHEFVHFLGFRSNIRDYFAASDIGFLPSRFKGESSPLVLIDCLLSGKPVLASNIGEIRYMLDSPEGLAGELFNLEEWEIRIEVVGNIILTLANDPLAYQRLLRCVPLAAAKFEACTMVDKYEGIYREVLAAAESDAVSSAMKCTGSQS
ncbi:MAG TPA: glycosyltransferase [Candidatus Binatia bacterium]|nr:glycosyltransferase [Candidatus Binatia bacterium]